MAERRSGGPLGPEAASLSAPGDGCWWWSLAGSVHPPWSIPGPAVSHLLWQDMWLIEGALEVHLGEFHVRMKGNRTGLGAGSQLGGASDLLRDPVLRMGGDGQNPRVSTPVTCDFGQVLSAL